MPQHTTLVTVTMNERFRIYEKMKSLVVIVEPNEDINEQFIRYIDGHTDESIAALIGGKVNKNHIRTIRLEGFGRLHSPIGSRAKSSDTKKQVDDVRAAVFDLVNKLVKTNHISQDDADEILDGIVG